MTRARDSGINLITADKIRLCRYLYYFDKDIESCVGLLGNMWTRNELFGQKPLSKT